jgi:fermentation-respiration switch protein FrsA (DUF1100 family)
VTLGAHEVDDLAVVIEHLRTQGGVSSIGLWGRSMGAVTALLYSARDPDIAGMVRGCGRQDSLVVVWSMCRYLESAREDCLGQPAFCGLEKVYTCKFCTTGFCCCCCCCCCAGA